MELRFVLEQAEAEVATARKMFFAGDRDMCTSLLEGLTRYLIQAFNEGIEPTPNIDVKPPEPE